MCKVPYVFSFFSTLILSFHLFSAGGVGERACSYEVAQQMLLSRLSLVSVITLEVYPLQ